MIGVRIRLESAGEIMKNKVCDLVQRIVRFRPVGFE